MPRSEVAAGSSVVATRVEEPRALTDLLDDLPDQAAVVDDRGVVVSVNRRWRHFAQNRCGDCVLAEPGADYLSVLRSTEGARSEARAFEALLRGQRQHLEWEYPCHGSRARCWFLTRATRLRGGGVLVVHSDITSRKLMEMKLISEAHHDQLTGLLNRRGLEQRWQHDPSRFGVGLMLDCDDFKAVNERFGHAGGDQVLRELATRFRSLQRPGQRIARVGGDEFVWLLPEHDNHAALDFAGRLRRAVGARPVNCTLGTATVTVSVAVVALNPWVTTLHDLLEVTHGTLRECKTSGKNRVSCPPDLELRRS